MINERFNEKLARFLHKRGVSDAGLIQLKTDQMVTDEKDRKLIHEFLLLVIADDNWLIHPKVRGNPRFPEGVARG